MKMIYTKSFLSYLQYKNNNLNSSEKYFRKALSGQIGKKEPVLSLFLRKNEHYYLLNLLNSIDWLDSDYKNSLLAKVYSYQKDYSEGFKLIKQIENQNILKQQINLAYTLRDIKYIDQVNLNNIDVLSYLNTTQIKNIIQYLTYYDREELCIRLINQSNLNHAFLFDIMENSSKNTLKQYKWEPFKKNYLAIIENPKPEELEWIFKKLDNLNFKFKIVGHIHLINNFYMFDNYQQLLNDVSVPILNNEPNYFNYINKEALETLNFDFTYENENENDKLLSYYLENYKYHPNQTINYFLKTLPYLSNNSRYSFFLSKALNDKVLQIDNPAIKDWVHRTNKNLDVFHNKNLFINPEINQQIDKFVCFNFNYQQKKTIYTKIISQLVKSSELLALPSYFVEYLENNKGKVFNTITLIKHYYAISSVDNLDNIFNGIKKSSLLKIFLNLAKVFFKNNMIREALDMTIRAEKISSINHQVFRNYIRIYHFSGNITKRAKYLQLMKVHFPEKVYGNELKMALQEKELLTDIWLPYTNHSSSSYKEKQKNENKILFVLNKAYPAINGYTVRSDEIIQSLSKLNYKPVIATRLGWSPLLENHTKPNKYKNGFKVYYIDQTENYLTYQTPIKDYFQKYTEEIERIVLKERPEYIYAASNFQNALPSLVVGKNYNIPTIYEVRGMWQYTQSTKNPYFYQSERFYLHEKYEIECCKLANRVTCICNSLKNYLIKKGVEPAKIDVVSNGVNTNELKPISKDKNLEKQYDLNNKVVIGFVGSITAYEGLDYLLDAVKIINERKLYHKDFILFIVGDGSYLDTLKLKAKSLKIEKHVKFVGRVSRDMIPSIYSLIDIAPFPRIDIDLCQLVTPLKPYEAMAFSKKVLVSDLNALKEMVIPNVNGLIFKSNDLNDLVSTLIEIVDKEKISNKCREWVKNNKDWDVIGKQLQHVFNKTKKYNTSS